MKAKSLKLTGGPIVLAAVLIAYQNCSPGQVETSRVASTASESSTSVKLEDDLKPMQTTSSESLEQSMLQLTGITNPSQAVISAIQSANSKLSATGDADTVNAAMLLAVANVAGELCAQLVNEERALPAAQRRFFRAIDFNRGPASVTTDQRADMMKRLVRGFAAEDINSAELAYSQMTLSDFVSLPRLAGASDQTETQNLAIFACTGTLASLRANLIE